MSKLLTVKDMAIRLQLKPNTIYRLKDAGKLAPNIQIGRNVYWRESTVEEWEKGLEDK